MAVHVDQGVDGVLVTVYQGRQDVHGATDDDREQQESDQRLLGSVEQPASRSSEAFTLTEQIGEWQEEEQRDIGESEDEIPDAVDEAGVEPLDVPGPRVPVQHLVTDGRYGQQHGGSHGNRQRETAAPQRYLVDPEVGGVRVWQELLILFSSE